MRTVFITAIVSVLATLLATEIYVMLAGSNTNKSNISSTQTRPSISSQTPNPQDTSSQNTASQTLVLPVGMNGKSVSSVALQYVFDTKIQSINKTTDQAAELTTDIEGLPLLPVTVATNILSQKETQRRLGVDDLKPGQEIKAIAVYAPLQKQWTTTVLIIK